MRSLSFVALLAMFTFSTWDANLRASLFVGFEGTSITWSNTGLFAGPPQPLGYIEIPDVVGTFTGDISAQDFLSLSPVTYGSASPISWNQSHLLSSSTVSFSNGTLTDINIAFDNAGTLLTLSGPPTANWAVTNSPQPPSVPFPGFPDFGAGFARGDLQLTVSTEMPVIGPVTPIVPPVSDPSYAALVVAEISNGYIEFDPAGVEFTGEFAHLNEGGPFVAIATFNQEVIFNNELDPSIDRLWFTNVDVDHEGSLTVGDVDIPFTDSDLDPDGDGYWILNGEAFSVDDLNAVFEANLAQVCDTINGLGIGVCVVEGDFNNATVAIGLRPNDILTPEDLLLLESLGIPPDALTGSSRFHSQFGGTLTYQAVTVPVNESVPEPTSLLIWLTIGLSMGLVYKRNLATGLLTS